MAWLTGYSYRMDVPVANPSQVANRQLRIPFPGWFLRAHPDGAKILKADFSDVHATKADGVTELPCSINTARTEVTVDFATMPVGQTTLYLYYGNASATAPTAPASLLPRDTFTSGWGDGITLYVDDANRRPEQGAAWLKHPIGNTGNAAMYRGAARAMDANAVFYYSPTTIPTADYSVFGTFRLLGVPGGSIGLYGRMKSTNPIDAYRVYADGINLYLQAFVAGAGGFQISVPHASASFPSSRIELRMTGSLIEVYRDGIQVLSQTDTNVTAANFAGFHVVGIAGGYTDAARMDIDDFLVQVDPTDFTNAGTQVVHANGEVTSEADTSPTDYIWGADIDQCSLDSANPDVYSGGAATNHAVGVRSTGQMHHLLNKPGEWMLRKGTVANARLWLYAESNTNIAASTELRAHRLKNYGEDSSDVPTRHTRWVRTGWCCDEYRNRPTWNNRMYYNVNLFDAPWQTAGATNANEVDLAEYSSLTLAPGFTAGYKAFSIPSSWVQAWQGDTYSFGVLVKDSADTSGTNRYTTITAPGQANTPVWQIDYDAVGGDQFNQRKLTSNTYQAATFAVQNRYLILPHENSFGVMNVVNAQLAVDFFYISPSGRIRRTLKSQRPNVGQFSATSPGWGLHRDPFTGRFWFAGSYSTNQELQVAYSEPDVCDGLTWTKPGAIGVYKGSFSARNDKLAMFYPNFGNTRAGDVLNYAPYDRPSDVWTAPQVVASMDPGTADINLASNIASTTAMTGAGTIQLVSTPTNYPPFGTVAIDSEFFWYSGKSGTNLTGVRRALGGSVAANHSNNIPVRIDGCQPSYVAISYDEALDIMRILFTVVSMSGQDFTPDTGRNYTTTSGYFYIKVVQFNYNYTRGRFEDPAGNDLTASLPLKHQTFPVISPSTIPSYAMNLLALVDGSALVTEIGWTGEPSQNPPADLWMARYQSGSWSLMDITGENFGEASLVQASPDNDIVMTGIVTPATMRRMVSNDAGATWTTAGDVATHQFAAPPNTAIWPISIWCSNCTEDGYLRGRGVVYYQHFTTFGSVFLTAVDFVPPARYVPSTINRFVRTG